MSKQPLGDIPLRDYLRMASVRRPFRRTRALLIAVACVGAFSAGRFGPWQGRGTMDLSYQEAVDILKGRPPQDWANENAVGALYNNLRSGIELMEKVAAEDTSAGGYATSYLGHIGVQGATGFARGLKQYPQRERVNARVQRTLVEAVQ